MTLAYLPPLDERYGREYCLSLIHICYFNDDRMVDIIKSIKQVYSDCALTLSIGEKSYETYKRFFDAGADRYLLRHETADNEHYSKLHPKNLSLDNRKQCLYNMKKIGFQTGAGFMAVSYTHLYKI